MDEIRSFWYNVVRIGLDCMVYQHHWYSFSGTTHEWAHMHMHILWVDTLIYCHLNLYIRLKILIIYSEHTDFESE